MLRQFYGGGGGLITQIMSAIPRLFLIVFFFYCHENVLEHGSLDLEVVFFSIKALFLSHLCPAIGKERRRETDCTRPSLVLKRVFVKSIFQL